MIWTDRCRCTIYIEIRGKKVPPLKFDLKGLGYRFLVQNASKTLQEPISGHISHVRTYPAKLWKIEILAQIMIFHIFGIAHYGLLYGQKWLEMWFIAVNGLSGPSKYLYILWMAYYDTKFKKRIPKPAVRGKFFWGFPLEFERYCHDTLQGPSSMYLASLRSRWSCIWHLPDLWGEQKDWKFSNFPLFQP